MAAPGTFRTRPRGQDKWDGVGWRQRSLFGALGLRGPLMDATQAESELLRKHAAGASRVVEIGVFEGVAAKLLREVMDSDGELVLIDPFPPGIFFGLNMARVVARRAVGSVPGATVHWVRGFSHEAVDEWAGKPTDFLRIDGEHTLEGIQRDWREWGESVVVGGHAVFHADVVPAELNSRDPLAADDLIVPWILENYPNWELVDRVDTTAVMRRIAT